MKKSTKPRPKPAPTLARLRARLREVKEELDEARQTLDAIRGGKVDALIVEGPAGERVFTLQGADHRYRRIVESMTEGAVIVNAEGVVLYANAAFAQLVGTQLERVLSSRLLQYVPDGAALTVNKMLREARAGGTAASKAELLAGPGKAIPVHISAASEEEHEWGGICLIVTDLTEAMRETQRQHADQFRQLIDNVPELAWHARPDGYIEFYNQRFYDYTGTTLEQMKGWGWKSLHHPDLISEVTSRWQRSIDTGESFEMEYPLRGRDGVYQWFLTRVRPLHDEAGQVVRWFGTSTNIDAQRRDATTRAFLAQASVAISGSLDFKETVTRLGKIAIPDFADVCTVYLSQQDGTIEQVATTARNGSQDADMRAVHRAGEYAKDARVGPPRVLRTGERDLVETVTDDILRGLSRNAEQLALLKHLNVQSWIGVPLTGQNGASGALFFALTTPGRRYQPSDFPVVEELGKRASTALDNSRLYKEAQSAAQSERRARDKAEEATRLKDEFLATLSHELRTPLNAILGWSRLLQAGSVKPERQGRALDTIVRNAVAQNQLVDDLLDVSRIVSGKMRLNIDMVEMARVVSAAIDVVQPAADAKEVRIHAPLDPDAGFVAGDASRLQQVVWNLLTNAVKFTPHGGRVHVSLRRQDSFVRLEVSDSGAGISAEFLPYVFDRFRQQDGSISRKTGGLGLGLAIVKNLVELHGGVVEVTSQGEGKGSTFLVRIPVAPMRSTSVPEVERSRFALGKEATQAPTYPAEIVGLKILVVEDEADTRDLLRTLLEQCAAVVTTAGSAAEALSTVESLRPDLIVSDIGMPEEDGYSFMRKLRARPREAGGRTPAVALTAYARPEDRTRALMEGFQNHASKPVDPQELLVILANLAGRFS